MPGEAGSGRGSAPRGARRTPHRGHGGRVQFLCTECGDSFGQWLGRCPSCSAWGSLKEHRVADAEESSRARRGAPGTAGRAGPAAVVRLGEIPVDSAPRIASGIGEFDRILGGGLVGGSVVLLGGDPGIGKSTLLLQVGGVLTTAGIRTLYVSGEESAGQVRLRSERLHGTAAGLHFLPETDLEAVAAAVEQLDPQVLFLDSIQTAYLSSVGSAPGSLAQVRESALAVLNLAKSRCMAAILVGHVTKDGMLAGPKTLEHMVDVVLSMEGERYQHYRVLRCVKNRFGSVHEIGVFEMADDGLREVPNPSKLFLGENTSGAVGSVVVAGLEGTRALLMEVQALVHETRYGTPQRVSTGYDARRLAILLAVLAKRGGVETSQHDVFVSVAGGLRVEEPGVDLGILLAVASSRLDRPPHPKMLVLGEVGLGGEVRRVSHPEWRLSEAARLGFTRALLPAANARDLGADREGIALSGVQAVVEALGEGLRGREGTDYEPVRV